MELSNDQKSKAKSDFLSNINGDDGDEALSVALLSIIRVSVRSQVRQMTIVGEGSIMVSSTGMGQFQINKM